MPAPQFYGVMSASDRSEELKHQNEHLHDPNTSNFHLSPPGWDMPKPQDMDQINYQGGQMQGSGFTNNNNMGQRPMQ